MARRIVMIGLAAAAETVKVLSERSAELTKLYSSAYLERTLKINRETAFSDKSSIFAEFSEEETEGCESGVYRALWQLGVKQKAGFEVYFDRIPIDQGAIEMADRFDYDPYDCSAGAFIAASDNAEELVKRALQEGIPAAVIGVFTDNNDRVVINGAVKRFLTPTGKD